MQPPPINAKMVPGFLAEELVEQLPIVALENVNLVSVGTLHRAKSVTIQQLTRTLQAVTMRRRSNPIPTMLWEHKGRIEHGDLGTTRQGIY